MNFLLVWGWKAIPNDTGYLVNGSTYFTIIITVRDEEKNILSLLKDLENQSYSKTHFEIIIFDDHSSDNTYSLIKEYSAKSKLSITVERLSGISFSPKKKAISLGVESARGQWILITDGDCRLPEHWVAAFANVIASRRVSFIFGPVSFLKDSSFINKILSIEFASLMGVGAAALHYQNPVTCNAANLGFSKTAFVEVGGYQGNQTIASGDDVFLMKKMHMKNPQEVCFVKNTNALVLTEPESTFSSFFNQRVRWASKWKLTGGALNKIIPIYIFVFHAANLLLYGLVFSGRINILIGILLILLKFICEFLFLRPMMKLINRKVSFILYLITSLIYPFYAVLFGIAANFGIYTWKGRNYKVKNDRP